MPVLDKHPVIIAVVGMAGSGKSRAVEFFEEKGFEKVYFGDAVLREIRDRGLPKGEDSEREIRVALREKYGMSAFARLNEEEIRRVLTKKQDVVIDGLYSWDELTYLWDKFPKKICVVAIVATKEVRYKRLSERPVRPLTKKEARQRDISEIEQSAKGGPIAMADFTITNDGTLERLFSKLNGTVLYRIRHE